MSYDETVDAPYLKCPRFAHCSVNHCPLDPRRAERESDPGDEETKCGSTRKARVALAAGHPELLPWGGLTEAEQSRERRKTIWAALPEEEKHARLANLKPFPRRRG